MKQELANSKEMLKVKENEVKHNKHLAKTIDDKDNEINILKAKYDEIKNKYETVRTEKNLEETEIKRCESQIQIFEDNDKHQSYQIKTLDRENDKLK